ncbi:MAG: hypothetical protein K2L21_07310 [Muribaculaceae bacterium]|nr:hypothetical protein [Muribaculaceae bacterium]
MNYRRYIRPALSVITAVIGILTAFTFIRCGVDFMDEPYELMNAQHPLDSPLAPLPAWIGHLQQCPLSSLISMRWNSFIITLASIAVATLLCRRRLISGDGADYAALSFGVATMLAAPYVGAWLYGWDIYSNASLSITMAWLCLLVRKPSCATAFIGGVLAAGAMLCRVPNVVLLPAVTAVAVYALPQRRWSAIVAVLTAFAVVVVGFVLWAYGSVGHYLEAIAANSPGGHSIPTLIQNTFSGLVWFAPLLCSAICLFLLIRYAGMRYGFATWRFWSLGIAGAALLGLVFRLTVWKYTVVEQMAECIVIPLLLYPLFRRKGVDGTTKVLALAALWTGFCAVAGSNTGFIKFLSIGMFPIAVAISRPWQSRPLGIWLIMIVAVYCCVGGYVRCVEGYKDVGPACIEERVMIAGHPMSGIGTTKQFADYTEKACTLSRDLREKGYEVRVLASGLNRFGWALITGAPMMVNHHNWAEENMSISNSPQFRQAMHEVLTIPDVAVIVPAPFAGEIQCREFAPYDEELIEALSMHLREDSSGIKGVRLFCGIPRQQ